MKTFGLLMATLGVAVFAFKIYSQTPATIHRPIGVLPHASAETMARNAERDAHGVAPACAPHCVWQSDEAPSGKKRHHHNKHRRKHHHHH